METFEELITSGMVWTPEQKPFGGALRSPTTGEPTQRAVPFGIGDIDNALPQSGLPRGGFHEFIAPLPPHAMLAVLAGNAKEQKTSRSIVWIGKELWPTPHLISRTAGKEHQTLLIDPPSRRSVLSIIDTVLRNPAVGTVITILPTLTIGTAKRFSLLARENGTLLLVVRGKEATLSTTAISSWSVVSAPTTNATPRYRLKLLRYRGTHLHHDEWLVDLDENTDSPLSLRLKLEAGCYRSNFSRGEAREAS